MQRCFYQLDANLLGSTLGVNKDSGESVELTAFDKLVYTYMRNKYLYFISKNARLSESLPVMAKACGIGRSTLVKSINKLEKIGLIVKDTQRDPSGNRVTYYTVYDLTHCLLKF